MKLPLIRRQLPPTAGLPLRWGDLCGRRADFAGLLAQQLDIPRPLLTCSGTAALIVALRTLQQRWPKRHQLIVTAWTCPLVAMAVCHCPPLRVVPCDMLPGSIDFDPCQLAQLCGERTLAVVVTHLAGRVADAATAKAIASRCGAAVIEDAAQALGARVNDSSVGLVGDVAFFSMATGKGLTTVEGGVLFSRSAELHAELDHRLQRDLPRRAGWELRRIAELYGYRLFYHPDRLDWVYGRQQRSALARGDAVAAVGDDFTVADIPLHTLGSYRQRVAAAALARLPRWQHDNRQRALRRLAELERLPGVTVLRDAPGQQGVWPFFLLLMPDRAVRDRALQALWCAGLGVTRLFIDVVQHSRAAARFCQQTNTPNAEDFAARSLTISNSAWLNDDDFFLIIRTLQAASVPHGAVQ